MKKGIFYQIGSHLIPSCVFNWLVWKLFFVYCLGTLNQPSRPRIQANFNLCFGNCVITFTNIYFSIYKSQVQEQEGL